MATLLPWSGVWRTSQSIPSTSSSANSKVSVMKALSGRSALASATLLLNRAKTAVLT